MATIGIIVLPLQVLLQESSLFKKRSQNKYIKFINEFTLIETHCLKYKLLSLVPFLTPLSRCTWKPVENLWYYGYLNPEI
jgi:hypothetical protein